MSTLTHAVETAQRWIKDFEREMVWDDEQRAWTVVRAVLHALRDRLGDDESAQIAAQLPTLWRGVWFEGWRPHRAQDKSRTAETFLDLVRRHAAPLELFDVVAIVKAVFAVLARHLSKGEVDSIRGVLPAEIAAWMPNASAKPS